MPRLPNQLPSSGEPAPLPPRYQPKDAIKYTGDVTMIMTGVGLALSAVQNSLAKTNVGARGVFTRTGGTIAAYAAMGASFAFISTASANLREKDDSWNKGFGGFAAGSVVGLKMRSMPAFFGMGACLGIIMAAFDYTGGKLYGTRLDGEVDEIARKEFLRKNRRRPIEETIAELGEGRGVYAPGYQERRRERIKEKYGIDVPTKPAPPY